MTQRALVLPLVAALLTVTACSSGPDDADGGAVMGNATPAPAPATTAPDGQVVESVPGVAEIRDIAAVGDTLAVRGPDTLVIGSAAAVRSGDASRETVPETCGELTVSADTFVLPCGDEVRLFSAADPDHPETRPVAGGGARHAALVGSGELFTSDGDNPVVVMHRPDGSTEDIDVEDPATQLVAVADSAGRDAVVRSFRPDTTVQDLDWTHEPPRQGGRLRVGLGVGEIAPGGDGMLLAADAGGGQLAVYSTDGVIRLHQTVPVDGGPWTVAWDPKEKLAWVSSTGTATLSAWDVSTGVPVQRAERAAVADARDLAVLADGTVVAASAGGAGLQFIPHAAES